jgi:hypothetical protein
MTMSNTYEDYYQLALQITHNPSQQVPDWISAAQGLAEVMYNGRPHGAPAPVQPEGSPGGGAFEPQRPQGSRFGAAFDGWDEVALIQILISAQALVIARVGGADEEQLKTPVQQLYSAIDDLQEKYLERQGK